MTNTLKNSIGTFSSELEAERFCWENLMTGVWVEFTQGEWHVLCHENLLR